MITLVESLEDENMVLMRSMIDLDWNFNSSQQEVPSSTITDTADHSLEPKLPPIRSIKSMPVRQEILDIDQTALDIFSDEMDTRNVLMEEFGVKGEKMNWRREDLTF